MAHINKAYKSGTPVRDVLNDIAKSLGMSVDDALKELQKHQLGQLLKSDSVSGNSANELQKMLKKLGLSASVQDGALQIVPINKALDKVAVVLSATTGLLKSPTMGTEGRIRVKTLLMHELMPGRQIKIKDEPQFYRIEQISERNPDPFKGGLASARLYNKNDSVLALH